MKPLVGLLYNPVIPSVLDAIGSKVDFIEIVPDRLWYDNGLGTENRFSLAVSAIQEAKKYAEGYQVIGHGIGLSLPSAMPLDEELLSQVAWSHQEFSYNWYSEHLSMFIVPNRTVPNAQAGLGLPVVYNREMLGIIIPKIQKLSNTLRIPILLENPTVFTSIPEQELSEPQFFKHLYEEAGCGILLDLHNLYANTINLGISADDYLVSLVPESVIEIHLAGGDTLQGFYTDSHSRRTPSRVWELLYDWAPSFPNLKAITFEYHESYHKRFGIQGISQELDLMHNLAKAVESSQMVSR